MNKMRVPDVINLERKWRLGEQLGAGGFASVHLARSENGEPAVVKLIPKAPGAQRELLFEDLDGVPNVVPVLDRGDWNDYWALVMPLAEKSLRGYLNELGRQLPVDDAVSVLVDIAGALVAIEGRVVHRDIKPDNILLLDGRWCLADFGIARYTEATTAPDTRKTAKSQPYAAPEQWKEERATSATDVYAFGVVAYELLAGWLPFPGPDYRNQHLVDSVKPISGLPVRLQSLVEECLFKSASTRPAPQNLLARLQASMQPTSPAASRLQGANAAAVQKKAEEERQRSVAEAAADLRREMYEIAGQILERILAMLHRQIKDNAPLANSSSTPFPTAWSLNDAILLVDPVTMTAVQSSEGMPFEVVGHTKISIEIPLRDRQGYVGRSHSLWYCDAQKAEMFRWYETAFFDLKKHLRNGFAPFSLPPGELDAKHALGNYMRTVQVARPFMAIDQGEEECFTERWMDWFAAASEGQLRHPGRMPELYVGDSWRR